MAASPPGSAAWPKAVFLGLCFLVLAAPLCLEPVSLGAGRLGVGPRVAAAFPMPWKDGGSWTGFPSGFEAYYAAHFRLRGFYARFYAWGMWHAFHVTSWRVATGREGWLYYDTTDDGDPIATYRGTNLFTGGQLETIGESLAAWNAWLRARGIVFVVCIVPGKATVYPEYLPAGFAVNGRPTRVDQLADRCPGWGVEMIDLRTPLLRAKAAGRGMLYSRTDSHWTPDGAFPGTATLMEALSAHFPAIRPPRSADYVIRPQPAPPGDLAALIGVETGLSDVTVDYAPRAASAVRADPAEKRKGVIVMEQPRPGLPKAMVFRDSFAKAMIPFLSEGFRRAMYVHDHQLDPAFIAEEKPDVVVLEMVERYLPRLLDLLPPEEMLRRYPVSYYDLPAR